MIHLRPARALPVLGLLALTSGCVALGAWPYPDRAYPRLPDTVAPQMRAATAVDPLANVCHLTTERRHPKRLWLPFLPVTSTGSAALIDGRYLITAAHNVADYPGGNQLRRIEVRCNAPVASERPADVVLFRADIKARVAVPRYAYRIRIPSSNRKFQFDYAFVDLGVTLPSRSAFLLDPAVRPDSGDVVLLAGYPGGKISNTDTLHQGASVIRHRQPNLISYQINTATGNSGGPVWVIRDNRPYLVAVHVADRVGRLVNETFFADWQAWRRSRELSGTSPR